MDFKAFFNESILLEDNPNKEDAQVNYKAEKILLMVITFWNNFLDNKQDFEKTFQEMHDFFKYQTIGDKSDTKTSKMITNIDKAKYKTVKGQKELFPYYTKEKLKKIVIQFTEYFGTRKLNFIGTGGRETGSSISEEWRQLGGAGKKPGSKARFTVLGDESMRISFKNSLEHFYFRGKSGELTATFRAAFKTFGQTPKHMEDFLNVIKEELKEMKTPPRIAKSATALDDAYNEFIQSLKDKDIDTEDPGSILNYVETSGHEDSKLLIALKKQLDELRDVNNKLTPAIEKFFNDNKEFLAHFLLETLTGNIKYGKDSEGTANYLMMLDVDKFEIKMRSIDLALTTEFANRLSIRVSAALSSATQPSYKGKEYDAAIWNTLAIRESLLKDFILKHTILSEGVLENIKNILTNAFGWLYSKVVGMFKKGLDQGLSALGLKIESVDVDMNVSGKDMFNLLK